LMFSDEKYDNLVDEHKTLSDLIKEYIKGNPGLDFTKYRTTAEFKGGYSVDFIVPGEDLLDTMIHMWNTFGSPAQILEGLFREVIPQTYDYIIIDTAAFLDPRYTMATIRISNSLVIPLRASIVDIKRTARMIDKIRIELKNRFDGSTKAAEEFMRKNTHLVFNMVPTGNTYERRFVYFICRTSEKPDSHGTTTRLINAFEPLNGHVNVVNAYFDNTSHLNRFPTELDMKKLEESLKAVDRLFVCVVNSGCDYSWTVASE